MKIELKIEIDTEEEKDKETIEKFVVLLQELKAAIEGERDER